MALAEFQTPVDVGNRALQHVGDLRIATSDFSEDSKQAAAVGFCYDKLRRAELQRNVWRFSIRTAPLRAIGPGVLRFFAEAWTAPKVWPTGSVVFLDNQFWVATKNIAANAPSPNVTGGGWDVYYGTRVVPLYDATGVAAGTTSYFAGELVYTVSGVTPSIFLCLTQGTTDTPGTPPAWDPTITYSQYDTVTYLAVVYQSTIDLNLNQTPTGAGDWVVVPATSVQANSMSGQNWLQLSGCSLKSLRILYPVGTGPSTHATSKNVFMLPNGYLKEAHQDPKAGSVSFLGAPSGLSYDDWEFQDEFLTSRDRVVILLRFAADITDVTKMTSMFCEGLGCRIAAEVCEELTQSAEKLQTIASAYKAFMTEARIANGIETGSEEPPEDDYITCRV